MKTIKLGFTDTIPAISDFFLDIISQNPGWNIVRDDQEPEYLIFGDKNFGNNNQNYDPSKVIKIFFTGENQRPTDYVCHYSITFDHHEYDGKNYRLPLYVIYNSDNINKKTRHLGNCQRTKGDLKKEGFCSFVVQNPNGLKRNALFHGLSCFKEIDSAGPWLNNTGYTLPRDHTSVQSKLAYLEKFRFNLCCENSSYPGYATEKIYEAFIAKTIPIYWGSPTIAMDFNPKAFVNWHHYGNDLDFFQAIIDLENDPDKYEEMFFQPMFTNNECTPVWDESRLLKWFETTVFKREN